MKFKVTLFLIYSLFWMQVYGKFPDDIQRCTAGDIDCLTKVIQEIISKNPNGREDIGLKALEPLPVADRILSLGPNSTLTLHLKNIKLDGISKGQIDRLKGFGVNLDKNGYEFYFIYPVIDIKGQYKIDGRILLAPVSGEGDLKMKMDKVKLVMKFKTEITTKNDLKYLHIKKIKVVMEPSQVTFQLDNLFDDDEILTKNMNTALNENWKDVFHEIAPGINDMLAESFRDVVENVFQTVPFDDFYKSN